MPVDLGITQGQALAAEKAEHRLIKRLDRLQGRDTRTDYERRVAAEDLRLRQLRGEAIHIPLWMMDGSVRR